MVLNVYLKYVDVISLKTKHINALFFKKKKVVVTEQYYIEFTSTSYIYVSTRLAPTGSFHNKRIS